MPTIININIGGSPLPNQPGERSFRYLPDPEPIPVEGDEFDFLSEREFTPRYYVGLTPIADQIFTRAKNCKKGQACGNSCISLAKTCKKNLMVAQKPAAKNAWVKTKGKKSSGAAESATQAGKGAVETAKVKPAIDKAMEDAKSKNKQAASSPTLNGFQPNKEEMDRLKSDKETAIADLKKNGASLADEIYSARLKDPSYFDDKFDGLESEVLLASLKVQRLSLQKGKKAQSDLLVAKDDLVKLEGELKSLKANYEQLQSASVLYKEFQSSSFFPGKGDEGTDKEQKAYQNWFLDKEKTRIEKGFDVAESLLQGKPSLNTERIDKDDVLLKSKHGEKQINAYMNGVEKVLGDPDTKLFIAIGDSAITSVLTDKLKNVFELNDFDDNGYLDGREGSESSTLGIPGGSPPPGYSRPVYGYVESLSGMGTGSHKTTDGFGSVKLELKEEVKDRTTIKNGDSFGGEGPASLYTSPRPSSFTDLGGNPPASISQIRGNEPYLEFQASGGIRSQDIAAIHYLNGERPSPSALSSATAKGIPIFLDGVKIN